MSKERRERVAKERNRQKNGLPLWSKRRVTSRLGLAMTFYKTGREPLAKNVVWRACSDG